ncbi:hypothetical protein [Ahniella affigens]
MSNGASLFPVSCRLGENANLLAKEAGVSDFPVLTVEQLFR